MAFMDINFWRNVKDVVAEKLSEYFQYLNPDFSIEPPHSASDTESIANDFRHFNSVTQNLEVQLVGFRTKLEQLNEIIAQLHNSLNQVKDENLLLQESVTQQVVQQLMNYRQFKYLCRNTPSFTFSSNEDGIKIEGTIPKDVYSDRFLRCDQSTETEWATANISTSTQKDAIDLDTTNNQEENC